MMEKLKGYWKNASLAVKALILVGLLLVSVSVGYGLVSLYFTSPNTATYTGTLNVTMTLNGVGYTDGTPISWGDVVASTPYIKTLRVTNTGNVNASVTLSTVGLPAGWTMELMFTGSNLVTVGASKDFTMVLTTGTVQPQTYSWDSVLTVSPA